MHIYIKPEHVFLNLELASESPAELVKTDY